VALGSTQPLTEISKR